MTEKQAPPPAREPKDRKKPKNEGWIRWWGLGAFVGLTALLALLWLFLVDPFVKRMIEQTGTKLVGAKVELAAAHVTLSPLGLTLTRLQVTNPDEPMSNAVEAARIAMSLDGLNLFRRKVIIEEMAVEGLRFGTQRQSSGAVAPSREPGDAAKPAAKIPMPSFEVPDIKTVMATADLQSVKLAESLQADIKKAQDDWKKRLTELPDQRKLNDYKTRIEKLKSSAKGGLGGILGATGEVAAIQKDLEKDLEGIKNAKTDFDRQLADLKQRVDQAIKAPQEDVQRLQEKYRLSPQGLANMSGMLLGGKGGEWVRQGLAWYGKVQPMLAQAQVQPKGPEVVKPIRGKGVEVRFAEREPLPDFLIRTATVSAQLEAGDLNGKIENITPDQHILGKPLTFAFAGDKLKGVQSIRLDGAMNRVVPASPRDHAQVRVRGYQVQSMSLSDSADWPVTLGKAVADADLQATVSGQALAGQATVGLQSVKLTAGKPDAANPVIKAIGGALSSVTGFTVKAELSGTVEQYDVHLTSDLDRVLKDAVGKQVQALADQFTKELQAAVMAKAGGPLNELKSSFSGLGGIGNELASRLTQGSLGSALPSNPAEKLLPEGLKLPF
ncbi:MAG: TIGR03545 family protein [Nitrospirota bacterium]|nr:TIGR03545 family protein [Nitrospirota bacterium]